MLGTDGSQATQVRKEGTSVERRKQDKTSHVDLELGHYEFSNRYLTDIETNVYVCYVYTYLFL